MDEELHKVQRWASHGTLRQFASEVRAALSKTDERVEIEVQEDALTIARVRKEGGFLGIGARTVKDPVLRFKADAAGVVSVDENTADESFVHLLASALGQH